MHANQLRNLQLIAIGLIMGPIVFLAFAIVWRATRTTVGDAEAFSYVAVAFAVAAPMVAGALRARMSEPSVLEASSFEKARAALVVSMAILEGAVFLCAVALVFTPTWWPLVAAAIPLGTMLAWFPRSA